MYKYMTEQQIEIAKIRNIQLIHIYDLIEYRDDKSNKISIPALLIMYENTKTMNLCSVDGNYREFVQQVLYTYEKEHLHTSIEMDERTKWILENKSLSMQNRFYDTLKNLTGSYKPAIHIEIMELRRFQSFLAYTIEKLSSLTKKRISNVKEITGFRRSYSIPIDRDGKEDYLPLRYERLSETKYLFYLGRLFDLYHFTKVELELQKERVVIHFECKEVNLAGVDMYEFDGENIFYESSIVENGTQISYQNERIKQTIDQQILDAIKQISIDDTEETINHFLPWGMIHTIRTEITDEDEQIREQLSEYQYIAFYEKQISIYRQQSKLVTNERTGFSFTTDEVAMVQDYVLVSLGSNSDGIIQTKLCSKGYLRQGEFEKMLEKPWYIQSFTMDGDNFISNFGQMNYMPYER